MPSQLFDAGVPKALVQNAYTRDGYTFSGWNTMQGGNGTAYTNGQTITVTSDMTLYAQWTSNGTSGGGQSGSGTGSGTQGEEPHTVSSGVLNGHNYVDLGLSSGAKWATCNVGADTPEGYGNYYAWGETTPKETYNWETYIYAESDSYSDDKLTKYCTVARYGYNGFTDGFTTLEATDDAATVNWGSGWRMPTYGEMVELKINCTETWITQNGVNGCLFTGPNGNSIFLPLAGYRYNNSIEECYGDCGYYLSSSINPESPTFAYFYYFFFDTPTYMTHTERSCGHSVRAVCNQQ